MMSLSDNNNSELWDGRELHVREGSCKDVNWTYIAEIKGLKAHP